MVIVGGFQVPEAEPTYVSALPEPSLGCFKLYNVSPPPSQPSGAYHCYARYSTNLRIDTVQVSNERQIVEYVFSLNEPANTAIASSSLIEQLEKIVEGIQCSKKLAPLSNELDALYERAIASQGAPLNLDEWATQLANDVASLTD